MNFKNPYMHFDMDANYSHSGHIRLVSDVFEYCIILQVNRCHLIIQFTSTYFTRCTKFIACQATLNCTSYNIPEITERGGIGIMNSSFLLGAQISG